jgi:CHAT domain-containing protein/tetratricopeptide (TPR) repeat protein
VLAGATPAPDHPSARAEAERLVAEGRKARGQGTPEQLRAAIALWEASLPHWRAASDPRAEAEALRLIGSDLDDLGDDDLGRERLLRARALSVEAGDVRGEAEALDLLAYLESSTGRLDEAIAWSDLALERWPMAGHPEGEGVAWANRGTFHLGRGEYAEAYDAFQAALEQFAIAGVPRRAGIVYSHLGLLHDQQGDYQRAIEAHLQALRLAREAGAPNAMSLTAIGLLHHRLGEPDRALASYREALPLYDTGGARALRGLAIVRHDMGFAFAALGELQSAEESYLLALRGFQELGIASREAQTLHNLGAVLARAGREEEAEEAVGAALEVSRAAGDRRGEAYALHVSGLVSAAAGHPAPAADALRQALDAMRALGDRAGEAATLVALAEAQRDLGRLDEAVSLVDQALALRERLREGLSGLDLRATYVASYLSSYRLAVDLRIAQHERRPGEGHDRGAFEMSERGRARSLLEALPEAALAGARDADPTLVERERDLLREIHAAERRPVDPHRRGAPDEPAALARHFGEYRLLQAQAREKTPRHADWSQPRPIGLAETQALLDDDTALLEYALGEARSHLFVVTRTSLRHVELPEGARIEAAARRAHERLSARNRRALERPTAQALAELARLVLPRDAPELAGKRLLVVADGALQYVPFAALPAPRPGAGALDVGAPPLVSGHEVVHLPSASVLSVLRREQPGRSLATHRLAVIADPVFAADDPRVPASAMATRGAESDRRFQRLRFARQEAEAIAALVPEQDRLLALDFQADRAHLLAPGIAQYRWLHIATHGTVDDRHPDLSGLVLSLVDEAGRPREGLLRAHEIHRLRLGADLVVLSACETALGREVRGEGLYGLARGFLYAGAPRVVASLWSVRDEATAQLMSRFYAAMIKDGLPPSAALRRAQISLQAEPRWASPFYWAGFVLQGDWQAAGAGSVDVAPTH